MKSGGWSHPNLNHWWNLKDAVRARCHGRCEMCWLLRLGGHQLHHRHYATWGCERLHDVMLLCDYCHVWVSGKGDPPKRFRPGCLLEQGDRGWDVDGGFDVVTWQWKNYLQNLPWDSLKAAAVEMAARKLEEQHHALFHGKTKTCGCDVNPNPFCPVCLHISPEEAEISEEYEWSCRNW